MKAVIYARYSSDNQREESIEGQLRECTAYCKKNNITIVRSYIDRALSAKTDNRPDFQRMIKDSAKGLFDVILVWKHRLTMVNTPLNKALGVRNQIFHSNDTRSAVAWTWERMMSATCRRSSKSMLSQFPRWEDRYSIFCRETLSAFSAAISFISP